MPDSEILEKIHSAFTSIDRKLDAAKEERKNAQIWVTLMTAIVTSAVGFAAWYAQSRVEQHIEKNSQELATILALKQEVYGRELDRYESVHQQMAALVEALGQVEVDPTQKKAAADAIHKLYMTYTTDSLYLSNAVVDLLKKMVSASGQLPVMNSAGEAAAPASLAAMQDLDAQINAIEDQMKSDLKLTQLGQISGAEGKTPSDAAN